MFGGLIKAAATIVTAPVKIAANVAQNISDTIDEVVDEIEND